MTINEIFRQRQITEILHFTTNEGLLGILYSRSIKSRQRLPKEKTLEYIYKPNAVFRKDKEWLDYVNLSISRINYQFFDVSANRWHRHRNIWWCVLSFDPVILSHPGVYFATTNNMYTGVRRNIGANGMEALFDSPIVQWPGQTVRRDSNMPANFPTCSQAEVLYPEELPTEFLQRVYVSTGEDHDDICGQCAGVLHPDIEVKVLPEIFEER
ncbi:MAG: DUF4433 domain-containing protein [Desulfobacterales bacterium]|nr:DUF4433 domain-containing protein [Desulfobacterales bacterium]